MSLTVSNDALEAGIGTPCRPHVQVLDDAGDPRDLSSYIVVFAVKESTLDSSPYIIEPTYGTSDADGNVDVVITGEMLNPEYFPLICQGRFIAEFALYLDGAVEMRIQFPFVIKGTVIRQPIS